MSMSDPKIPGMHPEDIKAALRKRGWTLAAIGRSLGLKRAMVPGVVQGFTRSRRVEAEIARILELDAQQIWPNR